VSDVVLPLRARGGLAVVVEDGGVIGTLTAADVTSAMTLAGLSGRSEGPQGPGLSSTGAGSGPAAVLPAPNVTT